MTKGTLLPLYNQVPPTFNNTHPPPPPHTYHQQKRNSFTEVGDHFLKTRRFRILGATLGIFLCSLWILTHFSTFDHHRLIRGGVIRDGAALAAVIVLGENGEEGIHGLEVENQYIYNYPYDDVDDDDFNYIYNENEGLTSKINELKEKITMIEAVIEIEEKEDEEINSNDTSEQFSIQNSNNNDPKKEFLNYNEFKYFGNELGNKIENEINDLIHSSPVVVFSKTYCPYSLRAKHILSQYDILPRPLIIEVDKRDDAEEIKEALIRFTDRETFPNIFIDGKTIGGSDELVIMHTNGELKGLLLESNAIFDENIYDF